MPLVLALLMRLLMQGTAAAEPLRLAMLPTMLPWGPGLIPVSQVPLGLPLQLPLGLALAFALRALTLRLAMIGLARSTPALALMEGATLRPLAVLVRMVRSLPRRVLSRRVLPRSSRAGRALPEWPLRRPAALERAALRGRATRAARPISVWWFHCRPV
ncbi:MAG TPA: hypothetical protein VN702_19025 [Acetobacteraceae bacterium]|nr:hypothetical protein [Acetobacteraceae bacterium]